MNGSDLEYRRRPAIGLTTYLQQAQTGVWDVRASFLPAIYFEGVGLAGGMSVLLPPQPVDAAAADALLDGLLRRIHDAGVDVARGGEPEQCSGVVGALERVGRGLVDR